MSHRRSLSGVAPLGQTEGQRPAPAALSRPAQIILAAVALALFLPLAGLSSQSREALEQFHNRTLATWPSGRLMRKDPARYFTLGNAWFADRAYPLIAATRFGKSFLYAAFHVTPQANVSVSRDGFAFLAGRDASHPYSFLVNTCLSEPDTGARLQSAVDDIGRFARAQHYPIDIVLVPTIPTLYGDRLPRSIPAGYRAACAERVSGNSPLLGIRSVEGTRFVYPRQEMLARRNDPAFFPIGDYHPTGLSVQVVRAAYLKAIGIEAEVREDVALTSGPAEVLQDLGVDVDVPQYEISDARLEVDDAASHTMEAALARFYSQPRYPWVYDNPDPAIPQNILMISDSFGSNEGVSFAAAYRRVTQVWGPERDAADLLQQVGKLIPFDRVVLLFNEGNVLRVLEIAQALKAAMPAPTVH